MLESFTNFLPGDLISYVDPITVASGHRAAVHAYVGVYHQHHYVLKGSGEITIYPTDITFYAHKLARCNR